MRPDGSGLEQLTGDPAFDDQGALSPDGATLAFISTRGEGFANLWLLDVATPQEIQEPDQQAVRQLPAGWSPDGRGSPSVPTAMPTPALSRAWEHLQSTGIYVDSSGRQRHAPGHRSGGSRG